MFTVNDIFARAFRSGDIPVALEPQGMLRGDRRSPDGVTLVPWKQGRWLVWDFTCPDTLAPSPLFKTSLVAASEAETHKKAKFQALALTNTFVPIAVETLCTWGEEALSLVAELGRRISFLSGDLRSAAFLRRRIYIAIQRGNAASILGTIPRHIGE